MSDLVVNLEGGSITVVELNRGVSGTSGYSGRSGFSGANPGTSGTSGVSGKSGFSGRSGFSGTSGVGTSGFSGRSGYSGVSGGGGAWQSWTPTWTNVDVTTAPAATVVAKYTQVGKTVTARLALTLGAGSAVTGNVIFSLPVTSVSYPTSNRPPIGLATILDTGTIAFQGIVLWLSTTTAEVRVSTVGVTYVTEVSMSGTVPMTWTTSDELHIEFVYEAA